MPSPAADLRSLLVRHTALSVIVQGLLDTLLAKATILIDSASSFLLGRQVQ